MKEQSEFDWEPTPGLPAPLPAGEHIVWQGSPHWLALAIDAFHVRKVAIYFTILVLLQTMLLLPGGLTAERILAGPGLTTLLSLAAIGILTALAWLTATVTVYTLTNRRILIRFGIAIQLTINLPFSQIVAANLRTSSKGRGDIPLQLAPGKRVSYIVLWPHVRQWHFSRPEPMLRAIPDAAGVASQLARLVSEAASGVVAPVARDASTADAPTAAKPDAYRHPAHEAIGEARREPAFRDLASSVS